MKTNTLDTHLKEQRIKEKANILKNEALYKEKWLNFEKDKGNTEGIESINNLLFESLEAKLSVLNGYQAPQADAEVE